MQAVKRAFELIWNRVGAEFAERFNFSTGFLVVANI